MNLVVVREAVFALDHVVVYPEVTEEPPVAVDVDFFKILEAFPQRLFTCRRKGKDLRSDTPSSLWCSVNTLEIILTRETETETEKSNSDYRRGLTSERRNENGNTLPFTGISVGNCFSS